MYCEGALVRDEGVKIGVYGKGTPVNECGGEGVKLSECGECGPGMGSMSR